MYDANEAWKQALQNGGFEHYCSSMKDLRAIQRLGRAWEKILKLIGIKPPARLFELGCGGGRQLAKLALNGFEVHGIDVSEAVIARAQNFLEQVRSFHPIKTNIEVANIFDYQTAEDYDVCFHNGVVEHFLESTQRRQIWEKLYSMTRPNGWIVSIVPCGQYFMRNLVRKQYHIVPEIDYSCRLHRSEFEHFELHPIYTVPHNYFGFLTAHPSPVISKGLYLPLFALGNLSLPYLPISDNLKERCASSLIVVGRKPNV